MNPLAVLREKLRHWEIHPRRWLTGWCSYRRFLGYIKPELMTNSAAEYQVRRKLLAPGWRHQQLRAPIGKRLLVLAPHPDDESIGCGGLLLAHRECAEIDLILICNGDAGGRLDREANSLVEARKTELARAAAELGIKSVHRLEYRDGQVPLTTEAAERLGQLVRELRPDVVLLPWFLDGHPDHQATNWLFAHGCADLDVMVLGYEVWSLSEPNAIFDITAQLAAKQGLIRHYASQLRTVDYLNYVTGLAQVRAYQFPINATRTGAAEAYVALPNREYCALALSLTA